MFERLNSIHERYIYLEEQLGDPSIFSDQERFAETNKEYKKLEPIVETIKEYQLVVGNIASSKEMLGDPEMKEMAQMELEELNPKKTELEEKLKILLIPKDPEDERDVIFEIRAGTGGDEASLFAGDLYKMYSRYFDSMGWKTEPVTINEGTVGGYTKLVLEVTGTDVYGHLKFESGAHRVQRVPKTESKGRLHTSAATVVVMPKLILKDVNINKADLRTDTFRASGAGGQHVNKTESGVRFTHIPTGIVSESTDARSQIKNRDIALNRLYVKIYDAQREAHEAKVSQKRKSLVGSGDRADKIRTYNFPQNRVTDHRIGLSVNKLDRVLAGEVHDIIEALLMYENTEKLKGEEM